MHSVAAKSVKLPVMILLADQNFNDQLLPVCAQSTHWIGIKSNDLHRQKILFADAG